MRRARLVLALSALGACIPDSDPAWQLDHDRIVAVRAEPPALLPGEVGLLQILRAHAGGPTTVEPPTLASAPGPLYTAVHFNIDHWQIDGLAVDAPTPLDVELRVGRVGVDALYATKRVILGATAQNPPLPAVTIDGTPPAADVTIGTHRTVSLLIEATDVRWLTSCGELTDDSAPAATLTVDEICRGELVVVVRDGAGGVVWQVWPLAVD